MPAPALDPRHNRLLAALWDIDRRDWITQLEQVAMPVGRVLCEAGAIVDCVYFPTTSIVSLMYVLEDGATAETAVVGFEGVVGVSLFMGGESSPCAAVVRSAGSGFRLTAEALMQEFHNCGPVQHLMLRYAQAMITQMAQTAVCNPSAARGHHRCRTGVAEGRVRPVAAGRSRAVVPDLNGRHQVGGKRVMQRPDRQGGGRARGRGC